MYNILDYGVHHNIYGIHNVMSLHPLNDVLQSIFALSWLKRASRVVTSTAASQDQQIEVCTDSKMHRRERTSSIADGLCSDLTLYATYANCAYGWKFALLSGQIYTSNHRMLQRNLGIEKHNIIHEQWASQTFLPAHLIVRDDIRSEIVLCIRGSANLKDWMTLCCCTIATMDKGYSTRLQNTIVSAGTGLVTEGKAHSPEQEIKAHCGMIECAKRLDELLRDKINNEISSRRGYKLVITGHSLGGGVAAVLGSMWRTVFDGIRVFAYGCPCVGPRRSYPFDGDFITSVIMKGDPVSCYSIGHIADITKMLSILCEDAEKRREILQVSSSILRNRNDIDEKYVLKLRGIVKEVESNMQQEKHFPPGRMLCMNPTVTRIGSITDAAISDIQQESMLGSLHLCDSKFTNLFLHMPHQFEKISLTR